MMQRMVSHARFSRLLLHQLRNPRLLGDWEIGVAGVWNGEKNGA